MVTSHMFEGFPHKGGMFRASMTFGITKTCKYPKEAAALLEFMLNDPEGVALMANERGIPYSKAGLEALEASGNVDELTKMATEYALKDNTFPMDEYFECSGTRRQQKAYTIKYLMHLHMERQMLRGQLKCFWMA